MVELKAKIAIICDYHKPMGDAERWVSSDDGKAAIFVTGNPRPAITGHGAGLGFAWAVIEGTAYYSCYCSPNCTLEDYDYFLTGLEASIREHTTSPVNLVVAGDFNAHSAGWGSANNDARGSLLSDLISTLDLAICNRGSTPTYSRVNAESVIDITLERPLPDNYPLVTNWRVLEGTYSASDPAYVSYTVGVPRTPPTRGNSRGVRTPGWSIRKLNPAAAELYWALVGAPPLLSSSASGDEHADRLNVLLTGACDAAMPCRTLSNGKRQVHWWNNEIAALRKTAIAARRAYQRAGRRAVAPSREPENEKYKKANRELKIAIKKAQEEGWRELCRSVENDPWGVPYRLVTKRLGRRAPDLDSDMVARVARGLFPESPPISWDHVPTVRQQPSVIFDLSSLLADSPLVPPVTVEEVTVAVDRLPTKKAPGPDHIPNEIIKHAFPKFPGVFVECYNRCLSTGTFPARWKIAKLVLLYKGQGKALDQPSSYRPLSLLDGAGKVFERVLLNRLEPHIARVGALSESQYGFRRCRSTSGAVEEVLGVARAANRGPVQDRGLCVVVSLDVKNAFNSAPWLLIDKALRRCAVPEYLVEVLRSYMENRRLLTCEDAHISVTCGVPQGSVLGPTLWNLFYDGILRLPVRQGVRLVAFADDVAVVAVAHNAEMVEELVNTTLVDVVAWMTANGLRLAPEKTECVVLTTKKSYRDPHLTVQGCPIPVKRAIRYLGIRLDTRLSFVDHTTTVAAGARKAAAALGRLMPNVGGPTQSKRRLLMSVVMSRLLYGAEVWAEPVLSLQRTCNTLLQAQRCAALRVARCYRTVSDMASLVLAKMPPATVLALARKRAARAKRDGAVLDRKELMADTIRRWQALWESTTKAAWTKRLIPDLSRWWFHGPDQVSFHLAQILTGHGSFQKYLWTKNRAHNPACLLCPAEEDDAEHTLAVCVYWSGERRELEQSLGRPIRPEDVMEVLCGPIPADLPEDPLRSSRILAAASRIKSQFLQMIEEIMGRKEQLERERQHAAAADQLPIQ